MTAFTIDDKMFREYTKNKIKNAFLQKPIGIHDLLKEVDTQLHSYEIQRKASYDWDFYNYSGLFTHAIESISSI